jgi:hypothetical protein
MPGRPALLQPQVFLKLREANQRIAKDRVDRFAASLDGHFPQDRLDSTILSLKDTLAEVAAFFVRGS